MIDYGLRLLVVFALIFVIACCALGLLVLYEIRFHLRNLDKDYSKEELKKTEGQYLKHWALVLFLALFICGVYFFVSMP